MCFAKPPDPKPAPPPPSKADASIAAVNEARAQAAGRTSAAGNILTKLRDEDVAATGKKKRLGE